MLSVFGLWSTISFIRFAIRTFFGTFFTISSSTLVVYTLIILDTLRVKISTKHESEQTLGNKLYPIWLQFFGIIFLLIWKILMSTNFLNKLNCISFLTNLKLHDKPNNLIINFLRISTVHMVRSVSSCLYSSLYIL